MRACPHRSRWYAAVLMCGTLLCCATLAIAAPSKATAKGADAGSNKEELVEIFAQLRALPGIEAHFVEEKHLALLAAPLQSKGTLYFSAKGYLLRRITSPVASSVRITPSVMVVTDGGKTRRFDLTSHANIAHVVQSFLWILSGDLSALRAHFNLSFVASKNTNAHNSGGKENTENSTEWTLVLQPTDVQTAAMITSIRVEGRGVRVQEIRVTQNNGDTTITRIVKADVHRHFTAAQMRTLFGVSKP